MATPFMPLRALQTWYESDDGVIEVHLHFLDVTVTALVDGYATINDLPGLVPSTGNYQADTGIVTSWPLRYDDDTGVMELSLPAMSWASDDTYTLMWRWLVLARGDGIILTAIDYEVAQTLTAAPLKLWATESADIPGSFPVLTWSRA